MSIRLLRRSLGTGEWLHTYAVPTSRTPSPAPTSCTHAPVSWQILTCLPGRSTRMGPPFEATLFVAVAVQSVAVAAVAATAWQLLQAIARVTARCSAAFFCFQLYLAFLAVVGFWCDATARRKQALQSAIDRCYRQVVATVKSALAASAPAAVRFACAVLLLGTATWLVGVPPNPPAAWLIVGASFAHVVGTSSFPHVVANESEKEDGEDSTNEEDLPAPEEMTESQKIIAAFEEELEHENVSGPWDMERAIAASAISETERIERIRINEKLEAAMLSAAIAASLIEAARVEDAAGAAANTQIASWQMRGDVASAGPAANAEAAKAETASAEAAGMAAREYHDDSEDSSPSESEEWEEEGWLLL